jgi:hypothetical protein
MKALQVIDQAFRTTAEEQDDTILWLTQSMRGAGGDLALLLCGHATHYAVQRHAQPALTLGSWKQTQPANLPRDLAKLIATGVAVYVVGEDLEERGLSRLPVHPGVQIIKREDIAGLYDSVDQIWQW